MKHIVFFIVAALMIFLLGCPKEKDETKSIEQIQKEEGFPVRIVNLEPSTFVKELSYNATLSGIEETTVTTKVHDVVLKINANVGDYVSKGQVIINFPQDTPIAQYEQALSAFNNTKQMHERMQRLFSQGAISRQDMDNIQTAFDIAKANLNSSMQMINVQAPISGYLTSVKVNAGDKVGNGDVLFTVSNTTRYKSVIWIADNEILTVKKNMKATAKWGDLSLDGRITEIALAMDKDKKAFRAEVVFDAKMKQIITGVTVDILIETLRINKCLVISHKHIVKENGLKYVWIARDDKAFKTEIQTSQDNGIEYVVSKGLTAGDAIIIEGITPLFDSCRIKVVP